MKFGKNNFDTYIKIIYSSTVTTQLSILFLSESVIQKRFKFIAFDAQTIRTFPNMFPLFSCNFWVCPSLITQTLSIQ